MKSNTTKLLLVGACSLALPVISSASVLDWDVEDYSGGFLNQTFLNVDGSGVDVTFSFDYSNVSGTSMLPDDTSQTNGATPPINANFGDSNLPLAFGMDALTAGEWIDLTVSFSTPIDGLNFNIYDVDADDDSNNRGVYTDSVTLFANSGVTYGTITPGADILQSGANSEILTGTVSSSQDPGMFGNTVSADFGASVINSFQIRYSADGSVPSPDFQYISLGNLNFDVVPEPSSALLALGAGGILGFRRRRR